jgi:hypothetical protein
MMASWAETRSNTIETSKLTIHNECERVFDVVVLRQKKIKKYLPLPSLCYLWQIVKLL